MARSATPTRLPPPFSIPEQRAVPSRRSGLATMAALIALVALYALLFGWLSLARYWAYEMHALDMGNMGQAAWNTIHGRPFEFTNMRLPYAIEAWRTTTRLSFHVEPLFPVISLVYLVYPHPESLLVLQTLALAIGAIPVYLLARDVLASRLLALAFALAYLLFPTLEALNLYEFHPVALATPLLLFAFLFAHRRQNLPFVLCCLAAMGTKEEIGLVVAVFGLYAAFVQRNRRVGLAMAAVGVIWSLFAVLVVEHHFRQPGTQTYLRTRYGYLGHGVGGALHTVLHDPGVFFHVLFTWPKLGYLLRLLGPVGYLCLLAPAALLLGAPTLALNLLSQDPHMYSGVGDNSAELVSVVLIAAILGARLALNFLSLWLSAARARLALAAYILLMSLWYQHLDGFTPLGAMFQAPDIGSHAKLADRFVSLIPQSAPVSTQDQLDPHLSSRQYLYLFEDTGRQPPLRPANYILLDVSAPTYPLPSYQLHDRAVAWIRRPGWGVAAANDGLILIEKGASRKTPQDAFYRYVVVNRLPVMHRLHGSVGAIRLLGYDVSRTDLPNHRIPNLAYTFYLRPTGVVWRNMQPVVYELMGHRLIGCAHEPLGLAWLPTWQWRAGYTYRVRMDPLETQWQSPGTARLFVDLEPVPPDVPGRGHPACSALWKVHGRLWPVGSLDLQF